LALAGILVATPGHSQAINVRIENPDGGCPISPSKTGVGFRDSLSTMQALVTWRNDLLAAGYIDARIDSLRWKNDTLLGIANCGMLFTFESLERGNVPEEYFDATRNSITRNGKRAFRQSDLEELMAGVLRKAENQGFPFAEISLDSIEINKTGISAQLNMARNDFTRFDSLIIKGDSKTNARFIQNYLGLKKGTPYDQSLYDRIPTRLRELPFLRQLKPYEIGMRPGKADIYLYLSDRKASSFDGIIGIQPDRATAKTIITGDIKLNLLNSFKRGERVEMRWQRLQTRTQQLDLAFSYPYLLNTPVGVDFTFNLYRRDTLFSQIEAQIGAQYSLSGSNRVLAYFKNLQANVISPQATALDFVDSKTNLFGIGLDFSDLDYRRNPTKGYFFQSDIAAGKKEIEQDPTSDDSLFNSLVKNTDLYKGKLNLGVFLPLGNRSTFHIRSQLASIVNENLFRNEMYRIGGLKTLRGFDEQSIFASTYAIFSFEYRFILEENSNVFLFYDQAWYEDNASFSYVSDAPNSFGGGINFETGAGIFSLTYALGNRFNQGFEIRNGKVHFGFTSYF